MTEQKPKTISPGYPFNPVDSSHPSDGLHWTWFDHFKAELMSKKKPKPRPKPTTTVYK